MQTVVPNDKQFQAAFENASVSKSNLARYYLRILENQLNEPEPGLVSNTNQEQVNLEHILPQNPSLAWSHIDAETAKTYFNRIGNLALLQKRPNSEMGNLGFSEKLQYYQISPFQLTTSLADYTNWGTEQIDERQIWLASLAVKAWPIKVS
jgi:hypothetical protein